MSKQIADAVDRCFSSSNEIDSNGEQANIVDAVANVAQALRGVERAITPSGLLPGDTPDGGHVECLTEAVLSISYGLHAVSSSLQTIADAIERHGEA